MDPGRGLRAHRRGRDLRGALRVRLLVAASIAVAACRPADEPVPPDLAERNAALEAAREAIAALRDAGVPEARAALGHRDARVRRAAAERLGALGPTAAEALPDLEKALADENALAAVAAAIALADIGDERALPGLVRSLANGDPRVRLWAGKAIKRFGVRAVPVLIEALRSDSPWAGLSHADARGERIPLRAEAKIVLSEMGEVAVPGLIEALSHADRTVRLNASGALGRMGPKAKDAIPALIEALRSDDPGIRQNAAGDLGKIGDLDPAVIPALREATADSNREVAEEARAALKALEAANKEKNRDKPRPEPGSRSRFSPPPIDRTTRPETPERDSPNIP